MRLIKTISTFILTCLFCLAQTDEDVIRYTNISPGGTTRFIGMSGAMGALGGDMSCGSTNPAGLGILIRGNLNFSFGANFANTITEFNNNTTKKIDPTLTFNFTGISGTTADNKNTNNRYTLAISYNQLQNFSQYIEIKGKPTRGKSITLDMLDYAKGKPYTALDGLYEGAAYYTYLIDMLDTNNFNSYFSYIDTSKSFLQQKTINTSGRINELAVSFAYSINDDLYLGASIGIPFLKYIYQSDYKEADNQNQMYIIKNPNGTYSSSYSYPVNYYNGLGGIKDFHYQSTYTTTATGVNLKLGAIWRTNDYLRIGIYYHSPTWYDAKDTYYYVFTTNWDEGQSITQTVPDGGGLYKYKITIPSRTGIALSGILKNIMSINTDYELVNYSQGFLKSKDVGVFDNANKALKEKYKITGNIRCGIELNTKPVMFRLGWASYGSPFGHQVTGNAVKNSFSFGCGFKTTNFYYDFAIVKTYTNKQEYYMYNPEYCDVSNIKLNLTKLVFTIGLIGKRYDENVDCNKYIINDDYNYRPTDENKPDENKPDKNTQQRVPY